MTPAEALAAVRHDVLKHALWAARDGDAGGVTRALANVRDDEGTAIGALPRFRQLAPYLGAPAAAFEAALVRALEAPDPVAATLALEPAFDALRAAVGR